MRLRWLLSAALWVAACAPQPKRDGGGPGDLPAVRDAGDAPAPTDGADVPPMRDAPGTTDHLSPLDALLDGPPANVAALDAAADLPPSLHAPAGARPAGTRPASARPVDASAPSEVPLNAAYLAAIPVPPGDDVMVHASIGDATERIGICGTPALTNRGVRFYRATVPPGQSVDVSVFSTSPRPLVMTFADCALRSCIATRPFTISANFLYRWRNPDARPRDIFIAPTWNDQYTNLSTLPLRVRYREPGANLSCAAAIPLTLGRTLAGQEAIDATDLVPHCSHVDTGSRVGLWYRATVPPGQTLTVATVADNIAGVPLVLYSSCDAPSCLTTAATARSASTYITRWGNTDAAAREVMIAAIPTGGIAPAPRFAITATLSPAPPNLTCERAAAVANGAVLRAQDVTGASNFHAACPGTSMPPTPVLFYRTTVPPGQTLYADVTPTTVTSSGTRYLLRVAPDCSLATCLASSIPSAGPVEATWTNLSTNERPVVLTLGAVPAAAASLLDLAVRIGPPPTNSICTEPQRLTNGARVKVDTFRDAHDLVAACGAVRAGPALYYSVRLGAGQRLVATAEALSMTSRTTIRLVDSCAGGACLASATAVSPSPRNVSRLTYTHAGAARDLLLLLAPPLGSSTGATLTVAITP